MTGILLAGGKSKRMGMDKAFLRFKGRFLYEYPLAVLEKSCNEILISSSDKRFKKTGYTLVQDIFFNTGPMGGVYSCLKYASYERSLVLSCDIPFISVEFINKLAEGSKNYSITIGNNKRSQPEPLAGVYQKRILKTMEQYLQTGDYKMSNLLSLPDVRIIDTYREGFDPEILFFNVNSRDDLRKLNKAGELK